MKQRAPGRRHVKDTPTLLRRETERDAVSLCCFSLSCSFLPSCCCFMSLSGICASVCGNYVSSQGHFVSSGCFCGHFVTFYRAVTDIHKEILTITFNRRSGPGVTWLFGPWSLWPVCCFSNPSIDAHISPYCVVSWSKSPFLSTQQPTKHQQQHRATSRWQLRAFIKLQYPHSDFTLQLFLQYSTV